MRRQRPRPEWVSESKRPRIVPSAHTGRRREKLANSRRAERARVATATAAARTRVTHSRTRGRARTVRTLPRITKRTCACYTDPRDDDVSAHPPPRTARSRAHARQRTGSRMRPGGADLTHRLTSAEYRAIVFNATFFPSSPHHTVYKML